jgi:hypothetical protein
MRRRLTIRCRPTSLTGCGLSSNVSPQRVETVVDSSCSHSVQVALNTNTRFGRRWPQQASPTASTASVAVVVPPFATLQACAADPSKSGLLHTPAALCQFGRLRHCQALQVTRPRCLVSSPIAGERGASSGSNPASLQVNGRSFFRSCQFAASKRSLASNARPALPAKMHSQAVGRRFVPTQRANPSVKGTSCGKPQSAPYLER